LMKKTPEDFLFTIKGYQGLTHEIIDKNFLFWIRPPGEIGFRNYNNKNSVLVCNKKRYRNKVAKIKGMFQINKEKQKK
jgi:uncharacterized protein YecE (DUF72 family)